jgi:integrase
MALHELSQKELEKRIKDARAQGGVKKISDGEGLFLVQRPDGGLSWQLDYTLGKRKTYSIGTYPKVSLSTARTLAQQARQLVQLGHDPVAARKASRRAEEGALTVADLLQEWMSKNCANWSVRHITDIQQAMDKNVLPFVGSKAITEVTDDQVRIILEKVENRGANYMLDRVRSNLERCFQHAKDRGLIDENPVTRVALKTFTKHQEGHHPALTLPKDVRELLLKLDAEPVSNAIMALKFGTLTFVRPQTLRSASWADLDLDEAMWEVPHSKMKKERAFLVPLSRQAIELLRNWKTVTGRGTLVFPGEKPGRQMSENTLVANLWRMGFKGRHSAHGNRAMAKTLLEEGGFHSKYTKKQLAHDIDDKTERAYNRAEYLDIRIEMMQAWADYLDALRQDVHQPWRWFGSWRSRQSMPQSHSSATASAAQP